MICLYSPCVAHGHNMVTMYMMMVHSLSLLSLTTSLEQSLCVWQHFSFSHINDDVTPLVVKSNLGNSDKHKIQ